MTGFGFPMLVCLCCMLCSCDGKITKTPANGKTLSLKPGSTANLIWNFDDKPSSLTSRDWFFAPSGCPISTKLATISEDDSAEIKNYSNLSLPRIEIFKPATLCLHNVNQSNNGKYEFVIHTNDDRYQNSSVTVVVAEKISSTKSTTAQSTPTQATPTPTQATPTPTQATPTQATPTQPTPSKTSAGRSTHSGETGPTASPNTTSNTTSTPTSSSSPGGKGSNGTVTPPHDDNDDKGPNIGLIVGIVIGVLVLILIIGVVVYYRKSKEKHRRNCGDTDPVPGNNHELDNLKRSSDGVNADDTVKQELEYHNKEKAQ